MAASACRAPSPDPACAKASADEPDWRTRHCAEPVAARIREATGRDVWAELGGCPRSWREAAALYRRHGVRSLAELVSLVLGPPVDRKRVRRGDIVMVRGALGICRGDLAECFNAMVPMREAGVGWRLEPDARTS